VSTIITPPPELLLELLELLALPEELPLDAYCGKTIATDGLLLPPQAVRSAAAATAQPSSTD
jgi:hypothetical protein